ncbi:MAG: hypothetical protein ACHBNF_09855 [Chromatiales bacterium]
MTIYATAPDVADRAEGRDTRDQPYHSDGHQPHGKAMSQQEHGGQGGLRRA